MNDRIRSFDSLRGYCCLWIVVCHLMAILNLTAQYDLGLFYQGEIAVSMFFVLSGYCITGLITHRPEHYATFLFRRYLRAFPLLMAMMLLYLSQVDLILQALRTLDPSCAEVAVRLKIFAETKAHWVTHLLLHVTLLNGLFEGLFPFAGKTLLPPAWTLTVEWQYYLLAPFLAKVMKTRTALLVVLAVLLVRKLDPLQGFIITDYFEFFLLGIATYYLLDADPQRGASPAGTLAMVTVVLCAWFAHALVLCVWAGFILMSHGDMPPLVKKLFVYAFENPVGEFLGKISYSVYLSHMIVIYWCLHFLLPDPDPTRQLDNVLKLLAPTLVGTLLFSTALYYTLELPFMNMGRVWGRKLEARLRGGKGAALPAIAPSSAAE